MHDLMVMILNREAPGTHFNRKNDAEDDKNHNKKSKIDIIPFNHGNFIYRRSDSQDIFCPINILLTSKVVYD
jgi:hypothetical protein